MSEVKSLIAEIKSKGLLRAGDKLELLYVVAAQLQDNYAALEQDRNKIDEECIKHNNMAFKYQQRAEAAEAKLAELAKQQPIAYEVQLCWNKNGIEKSGTIEFRKTPPSPDESHGLKILPLFTHPAPAADLAELVPEQALNGQAGFLGDKEPYYNRGWNDCRAAILRKIEGAK